MPHTLYFTRQATEDWQVLRRQGGPALVARTHSLLDILKENPFATYPPFKKLHGPLQGLYARRINRQHRLVYEVMRNGDVEAIKVLSMWTHYRD